MKERGRLFVLSGFSGSGKGTIVKTLLRDHDNYILSVSMTTRAPRDEDREGVTYFFVTKEQFEERIAAGAMMEYARYGDNYYGTPQSFVEEKLAEGYDVILEIEAQGAMQIRKKAPDAVMMFLVTPTAAELERRLVGRGSETQESLTKRLRQAWTELDYIPQYDYMVVNDDLEACAALIHRLVHTRPDECRPDAAVIAAFREQLREILPRYGVTVDGAEG
ncbi:MAG: guanylate kinase [Lachnospiraceae bacterium]|nr:guanylate kinase [Lachnospiraceae bacterium]